MEHLQNRGQDDINKGLHEIEAYESATMPQEDFEFIGVLNDVIMAIPDDEGSSPGEIMRDGIVVSSDITKTCWRSAVIELVGSRVSDERLKMGTRIAYPSDMGISSVQMDHNGKKRTVIFLNEERIFGILKPKPVFE